MTGFTQDDTDVVVALSDGTSLRATFLVGCDGGRSVVRKAAGIDFAGWDPTTSWIIAEVEMEEVPEFGLRGGGGIGPAEEGRVGVTLIEPEVNHTDEPTLEDLRAALIRVDGTDHGAHSPRFISRFTDMTRQAVAYRSGRVLVAGDAAHVHAPMGGQGLNIGVQDAVNLGWKLAQVVSGTSPMSLLDTYQAERHPVGARVLRNTMAQRALGATDDRSVALRDIVAELLRMDEPRKHIAGMISGLDVAYDLGEGHPLLGTPDARPGSGDRGRHRAGVLLVAQAPSRCWSTSVTPAASTSQRGPTGSSSSTPRMRASGNFRYSARSMHRPLYWCVPMDTSPGLAMALTAGLRESLTRWFGNEVL